MNSGNTTDKSSTRLSRRSITDTRHAVFGVLSIISVVLPACGTGSGDSGSISIPAPATQAAQSEQSATDPAGSCPLSNQELLDSLLEKINQSRAYARQCGADGYSAADPLTWNTSLESAASKHSDDMARQNFFSHSGSDGLTASERISATGYNWLSVGENIAAGQQTVQSVVDGWLASPGHCANIMNPGYLELGGSCASSTTSDFGLYWTALFARSLNK